MKKLAPLKVGDVVQNQRGPHAWKWDQSGVIMEVLPYYQVQVRMDGSGKLSLRNLQFLRRVRVVPKSDNLIRDANMGKELASRGHHPVSSMEARLSSRRNFFASRRKSDEPPFGGISEAACSAALNKNFKIS